MRTSVEICQTSPHAFIPHTFIVWRVASFPLSHFCYLKCRRCDNLPRLLTIVRDWHILLFAIFNILQFPTTYVMSSGGVGPPNSAPCGNNTSVVVAQSSNDAPLPDGTSQRGVVAKDSCPQMPSTLPKSQGADWPSDLLYRLLVQSGVNCDKFANTSSINGAQDTGVSNDYFDNNAKAHPATTPNNISSGGPASTTTRPDELIVSVLQHILPGLKRPSTNERIATDIPWDDTRGEYRASTLADIKETDRKSVV